MGVDHRVTASMPSARFARTRRLLHETSVKQPLTAVSPRYCEPLVSRDILTNARHTDETSRSESGDPVCRPIRLVLFRLSFHLDLRCQASQEGRSGRSRRRGTIISGRFRFGKLVGSGRFSKCFFGCFCDGHMFNAHAQRAWSCHSFFANSARGTPRRSASGGEDTRPAADSNAATADA
jgi:hypothetical protein